MSYALQDAVWRSGLPGRLRLTALAMASYAADDGGSLRPAQLTVVEATGQSERKVRNDLEELINLGVLELLRRGNNGRASRYRFVSAALPVKVAARRRRQAESATANRHEVPVTETAQPAPRAASTGKSGRSNRHVVPPQPARRAGDPVRDPVRDPITDPVTTHTPRARGKKRRREHPVAVAIRELRETYEVAALWTREDGDEAHALAEFVTAGDVTRASQEVDIAPRPSWPLALSVLRRVAAARRDAVDPWAPPRRPQDRQRRESPPTKPDPYAHLYRRD